MQIKRDSTQEKVFRQNSVLPSSNKSKLSMLNYVDLKLRQNFNDRSVEGGGGGTIINFENEEEK